MKIDVIHVIIKVASAIASTAVVWISADGIVNSNSTMDSLFKRIFKKSPFELIHNPKTRLTIESACLIIGTTFLINTAFTDMRDLVWNVRSLADWIIAELEASTARAARDETAWQTARGSDTAESYGEYLKGFASGAHVDEAKTRIAELEASTARAARDETAWQTARGSDTAESYDEYLKGFASGAHVDEAKTRIAVQDEASWSQAHATNTIESLNRYLSDYPTGLHQIEARKEVQLLEAESAKASAIDHYNRGIAYEAGGGGNEAMALQEYKLAADQGVPAAIYKLGLYYESGRGGVKQDFLLAARNYRLAAQKGIRQASSMFEQLKKRAATTHSNSPIGNTNIAIQFGEDWVKGLGIGYKDYCGVMIAPKSSTVEKKDRDPSADIEYGTFNIFDWHRAIDGLNNISFSPAFTTKTLVDRDSAVLEINNNEFRLELDQDKMTFKTTEIQRLLIELRNSSEMKINLFLHEGRVIRFEYNTYHTGLAMDLAKLFCL